MKDSYQCIVGATDTFLVRPMILIWDQSQKIIPNLGNNPLNDFDWTGPIKITFMGQPN